MILPRTELSEARAMAERIRGRVAAIPVDGDLHVTMSIGVASFPESATDGDGVLGAADAALLRAKQRGRDRVCLFNEERADMAAALRGDLVAVGRRFADFIGLSEAETAGLVTALAVHETGGALQDEVQAILRGGEGGDAAAGRGARGGRGRPHLRQRALGRRGVPRGSSRQGHPSRGPRLRRVPALRRRPRTTATA